MAKEMKKIHLQIVQWKIIILDKITHIWKNKFVIIVGISKTRYIRTRTYLRFSKFSFFV